MTNTEIVRQLVLTSLDDNKALDITDIDVSSLTNIADRMIICSATSNRHANALADKLMRTLREHDIRPLGVEGTEQGDWILVDLSYVIVHIMLPEQRAFYDLEKLWSISQETRKKYED